MTYTHIDAEQASITVQHGISNLIKHGISYEAFVEHFSHTIQLLQDATVSYQYEKSKTPEQIAKLYTSYLAKYQEILWVRFTSETIALEEQNLAIPLLLSYIIQTLQKAKATSKQAKLWWLEQIATSYSEVPSDMLAGWTSKKQHELLATFLASMQAQGKQTTQATHKRSMFREYLLFFSIILGWRTSDMQTSKHSSNYIRVLLWVPYLQQSRTARAHRSKSRSRDLLAS